MEIEKCNAKIFITEVSKKPYVQLHFKDRNDFHRFNKTLQEHHTLASLKFNRRNTLIKQFVVIEKTEYFNELYFVERQLSWLIQKYLGMSTFKPLLNSVIDIRDYLRKLMRKHGYNGYF